MWSLQCLALYLSTTAEASEETGLPIPIYSQEANPTIAPSPLYSIVLCLGSHQGTMEQREMASKETFVSLPVEEIQDP